MSLLVGPGKLRLELVRSPQSGTACARERIERCNTSRTDCNSVLRSASIRKFALKQPSLLAGAVVHFSTAHHIVNGGNLVLRKERPLSHRLSPHGHAVVKSEGSFENSWIHINIQIGKIENGSGILSELRF